MMVALYERPDIEVRNKRIVEKFLSGEKSRKEIADELGVSYEVVCDAIKRWRRTSGRHTANRACRHCRRKR